MDTIKTLVISLCVSFVFLGVTMLLVPEGTIKKSFKTLVSVIIISVITTVVFGVSEAVQKVELNTDIINLEEISADFIETVNSQSVRSAQMSVKTVIDNALKQDNIKTAEVFVSANISDDYGIYINMVNVICDKSEIEECRKVLEKLSVDAQITERE